jgi:hypothetical protein
VASAAAVLWHPSEAAPAERLVAAQSAERALRRDLARMETERDALAARLASLERAVGEMKLAARDASAPDTTGSVERPAEPASAPEPKPSGFGLSFGSEISVDAVRRRWSTLVERHRN